MPVDPDLRRTLHELANHLGQVFAYAELLGMRPDLTDAQRSLVQPLLVGADDAGRMLARAQQLARAEEPSHALT